MRICKFRKQELTKDKEPVLLSTGEMWVGATAFDTICRMGTQVLLWLKDIGPIGMEVVGTPR